MNQVTKTKKLSMFKRWFFSYLVILLLVLSLSVILYVYTYDTVSDITQGTIDAQLESMQVEYDQYFSKAKEILNYLHLDTNMSKAVSKNQDFTVQDQEYLIEIYNELIFRTASSDIIDHIFVYLANGDRVLSSLGNMSSELFHELYYANASTSLEDFTTLLGERWIYDIYITENINGEDVIWILDNENPIDNGEVNSTFVISFSNEEIYNQSMKYKWDEGIEIFLMSAEGDIIGIDEEQATYFEGLDTQWWLESTVENAYGETMAISYTDSAVTSLKYISLYPMSAATEVATGIQMIMLIGMIVCSILVTLIAYYLASMNYKSLKSVMDVFGKYDLPTMEKEGDEFQWLKAKGTTILSQQQKLKKQKDDAEEMLFQNALYRMITLPAESNRVLLKSDSIKEIDTYTYYMTGLLYVHDLPIGIDRSLYCFILQNILNEILEGEAKTYFVDLGESFGILSVSNNSIIEDRAAAEESILEFENKLKAILNKEIMICFGSEVRTTAQLYTSYKHASEVASYKNSNMNEIALWYDDIKTIPVFYQYSLEQEEKIIHLLLAKDHVAAKSVIAGIIEENVGEKMLSEGLVLCLQIELKGTFIKAAQQSGLSKYLDVLQKGLDTNTACDKPSVLQAFNYQVEMFCQSLEEKEALTQKDNNFSDKVKAYVEENYHDPDLNISITALEFKITPSYLSSLFKEETNMSLLDYINGTRIKYAKQLLQEGYSVIDIATKTGFRNSGSFIRTFKKITGITPGQFKNV